MVLARRFLVTGLLVALGLRLAAIAIQPIAAVYRSNRDIQALEKEYSVVRQRNAWLQNRLRYLNTSAGIEEEARRLGWVRGGEVPLLIVNLPAPSSAAGSLPSASRVRGSLPAAAATVAAQGSALSAQSLGPDFPAPSRTTSLRSAVPPRAQSQGTRPATGPRGWGESSESVRPRSATAERIEQFLATWGPTHWIGELLE